MGRAGDGSRDAVDNLNAGNSGRFQAGGELFGELFVCEGHNARTPAKGLHQGFVEVAASGQSGNRVSVRELLDDGEGALPNGAGGAEYGESFHCQDISLVEPGREGNEDTLEPLMNQLRVPKCCAAHLAARCLTDDNIACLRMAFMRD